MQLSIPTTFYSGSIFLAIANYPHNITKGEQETKLLCAKKVWDIVTMLVCKLGGFAITCLIKGGSSPPQLLLYSMPYFGNQKTQSGYQIAPYVIES